MHKSFVILIPPTGLYNFTQRTTEKQT